MESTSSGQFSLFDVVGRVTELNYRAMAATNRIISFKSSLLRDVLACRVFSFNYPLLIDYVLREAHFYLRALTVLQNRHELDLTLLGDHVVREANHYIRLLKTFKRNSSA